MLRERDQIAFEREMSAKLALRYSSILPKIVSFKVCNNIILTCGIIRFLSFLMHVCGPVL